MQTPAVRVRDAAAPNQKWWRGERNVTMFRFSWLRLYAAIAAWQSVLLILTCFFQSATTVPLFLSLLLAALLVDLAMAVVLTAAYPMRVSATGLQGFNFWGLLSRMRWEDMEAAVPTRFPRPALAQGTRPWSAHRDVAAALLRLRRIESVP